MGNINQDEFDPIKSENLKLLSSLVITLSNQEIIGNEENYLGYFKYNKKKINLDLEALPNEFEQTLKIAIMCLADTVFLKSCIDKAKVIVCDEFIDIYNEAWKEDDKKPDITHSDFIEKLEFNDLMCRDTSTIIIGFNDGGLFCGHGLNGASFDSGKTFIVAEM